DLEKTAAEDEAPDLFVADEVELLDQRMDRSFCGGKKLHSPSPWMEIGGHLDLVRRLVDDFADRGEVLKRLAGLELRSRRVEDDRVALRQTLHPRILPMIGLREAAGDADLDVRARYCVDPIAHDVTQWSRSGVRRPCRRSQSGAMGTALQITGTS